MFWRNSYVFLAFAKNQILLSGWFFTKSLVVKQIRSVRNLMSSIPPQMIWLGSTSDLTSVVTPFRREMKPRRNEARARTRAKPNSEWMSLLYVRCFMLPTWSLHYFYLAQQPQCRSWRLVEDFNKLELDLKAFRSNNAIWITYLQYLASISFRVSRGLSVEIAGSVIAPVQFLRVLSSKK